MKVLFSWSGNCNENRLNKHLKGAILQMGLFGDTVDNLFMHTHLSYLV